MECSGCGLTMVWTMVSCTPSNTVRTYKCECGHKATKQEAPKPPSFFSTE